MSKPPTLHRRELLAGAAGAALLSRPLWASAEPPALPFATDIRLPGLLHAVVARPPLPGWRLGLYDPTPALAVPGVVAVKPLVPWGEADLAQAGGVAVLARDTWSALRGRDALVPDWQEAAAPRALPACGAVFVPITAEPLMEPPSATVRVDASGCLAWASLAEPGRVRAVLAALLSLPPSVVALHAARPAAGPDRVSNPILVLEAALLSRAMAGAPVSLVWTHADDMPSRAPLPPVADS